MPTHRETGALAARVERQQYALLLAAGGVLGVWLAALVAWTGSETGRLLRARGLNPVVFGFRWDPARDAFGLLPFIWGSVVVGVLALLLAVPIGMALAAWTTRRTPKAVGRVARGALQVTVAIPSVIWGWWGLDVIVPWVRSVTGGPGFSLLAGGLTLALMLVPTLAVLAAEAIQAVPPTLEDASRALGAAEDETLWHVTLRAAGPGLARAVLLAAGRALAETMAVQMVVGNQVRARLDIAAPGSTLTTGILTHMAAFAPDSLGQAALAAMAFLLLGATAWLERVLRAVERGL